MDLEDDGYLKRAREAKGWSQRDLAERVGLKNHAGISLAEHRKRVPEHETLRAIAHEVGLPLSQLYLWITRSTDYP